MTAQYYIKFRGRTLGPFRLDQLKHLVKQGKLGRSQLVSEDGQNWLPATSVPDLFPAPPQESTQPTTITAGEAQTQELSVAAGAQATTQAREWYYADGNNPAGPIPESEIATLIATGKIRRDTMVWSEGMADWRPAAQTSLRSLFTQPAAPSTGVGFASPTETSITSTNVPAFLLQEAGRMAFWIRTAAIVLLCVLSIGSLIYLGLIFLHPSAVERFFYGVWLADSLALLTACIFLMLFANRISEFRYQPSFELLAKAFGNCRIATQIIAISTVVVVCIVVLVIFIAIAAGVDVVNLS